jgi:TetR/AcrR family transcriptional repressor of lmrAB and yxaGH operons
MMLEAAHTSDAIRAACAASYEDWQRKLCEYLVAHGVERAHADVLALLTLAAVEGGLILSRAQQSVAPLERIAAIIGDLVTDTRTVKRSPKSRRKRARNKTV